MLSASFGCISYLRGIFPDEDFLEERYTAASVVTGKRHGSIETGQRLMRLRRNSSTEVNNLLDYLVTFSLNCALALITVGDWGI